MATTFEELGIAVPAGATGEVDTLCPQCSHTRKKSGDKCLSVNTEDGVFHCHHCDFSGRVDRESKGYRKVYEKKKTYTIPQYAQPQELNPELVKWFKKRGIDTRVIEDEGISLDGGWIKFPYYRGGRVINIKSRKIDAKEFFQEKGAEKILYGMEVLPITGTLEPLIWVEGEIDRLSLLQAGYKYVVSVPDGAPTPNAKNTSVKMDYLENCEDYIKKFCEHIIAVDSDAPGQKLEEELGRRLGLEKCKRVTWPDGCKDANDVLVKHGAGTLKTCIEGARFYPIIGLFEIRDLLTDIMRMYDSGEQAGDSTGWQEVNSLYTCRKGEVTILTGIPMSGKSEWLDALTLNLAQGSGWSFGMFSPENAPLQRHFKKLAEKYIGKPMMAGPDRMSAKEVAEAAAWLQDRYYFICPSDDAMTIDQILKLARILVYRHGISGLVIDPYNEIDHSRSNGTSETEHVAELLGKIRRFARTHRVHVWLVAHPTKLQKREDGTYPCPTPYDISGSAHFRNRADCCIAVHRADPNKDQIELHVQKIKFKEIGKVGMLRLDYERGSGRFKVHYPSLIDQARPYQKKKKIPEGYIPTVEEIDRGVYKD